jgi:hypothetical protein
MDPADSIVVAALARGSELIHDFLTGTAVRNPRARLGLDHSGAPFGPRIVSSFGYCGFGAGGADWDRDEYAQTLFSGQVWIKPGSAYQAQNVYALVSGSGSGTLSGNVNGEAFSEAYVSGNQMIDLGITVPVIPGFNQIRALFEFSGNGSVLGFYLY